MNSTRKVALDYVNQWAPRFWLESESRVKEITQKFEESAKADFSAKIANLGIGLSGGKSVLTENKSEVQTRGYKVVNSLQIKELSSLVQLLADEIFVDDQQKHFVVIDTLDENWVDDRIKLKLIRALLEVVKSFQKIKKSKM